MLSAETRQSGTSPAQISQLPCLKERKPVADLCDNIASLQRYDSDRHARAICLEYLCHARFRAPYANTRLGTSGHDLQAAQRPSLMSCCLWGALVAQAGKPVAGQAPNKATQHAAGPATNDGSSATSPV